jgi:diacylglycerol O-acyltransferase
MKALSGVDATFLHLETASTPMHIASLSLFDLPPGYRHNFYAEVRRALAKRLDRVPIFHRKLAPMPLQFANPMWVDDAAVDLDHHLRRVTLSPPGSFEQLEDCAAALHSQPLDRSRPLWELTVIDGLASGQVGYYIKGHHAALDGQAGVLLAKTLFDLSPRPAAVRRAAATPPGAAEHPGALDLAAAALRHDAGQYIKLARHLPEVMRTLAGMLGPPEPAARRRRPGAQRFAFGPHTPLNVQITAERGFAAMSLPLDEVKAIAHAHEVTLNDVVLALCSGALRRYLADHGGIPRRPLTAAMPISLRAAGDAEYTIRATMPLVSLHSQIADPLRRLHAIHASAGAVKSLVHRAREVVPLDFPSIGAPWLLHGLAELYGRARIGELVPPLANVVISNIHGPDLPLYAAGARMSGYWPMSIVDHGLGLNITVMSYAGAMGFGFTTARAAVPDPHQLTATLLSAYDELKAKTKRARDAGAHRAAA